MFLIFLGWVNGVCFEDGLDEINKGKDRRRGRRKFLYVVEGGWRGFRLLVFLYFFLDIFIFFSDIFIFF